MNELIIASISLLIGGVAVWLIGLLTLKKRYESENQHIRDELNATISSLQERLDEERDSLNRSQLLSKECQKSYEDVRSNYHRLEQESAIYKERLRESHDKLLKCKKLQEEYKNLQSVYEESKLKLTTSLSIAKSTMAERDIYLKKLEDEREEQNSKLDMVYSQLTQSQNSIKELEGRLESEMRSSREKIEILQSAKADMKLEFTQLAHSILKENSQSFSEQNIESINSMISPIKEQFEEFKKQINDVYVKETQERSMLQAEIKNIKEINMQMSREANNLTNALKGESKTQGIWGEMILERVLENSGLKAGESYKREVSLEHESDGSRYRPDVIVYLPDSREIIIDAKTSLRAYERYISEENEEYKAKHADQHIASIKKHIQDLSTKDYRGLRGVETLDFIFMFIPIESALLMAMEYDSTLFDYAFKKNVILVGPTTLMVALRAVENTWRYEHQRRNATEIAKRAGHLFDKFVGFVEDMDKLGSQISRAQKTYDETYRKLHTGNGSITSQFKKLEILGAAATKDLPNHILKEIES
ncbi:DNA recombination protein RmuC [hydrothermal vent metagenome]|uniref:DNA recombination protein RmuC n=1 Tax=hydrothermal vent metagenome TaxID=652676 RepID=A0A1W1BJI5_9ZZZZ